MQNNPLSIFQTGLKSSPLATLDPRSVSIIPCQEKTAIGILKKLVRYFSNVGLL